MSNSSTVLLDVDDRVAILTLNRPEKLNALNQEVLLQLEAHLDRLATDVGVHAIVLTGAGRAFSAGADLSGGDSRRNAVELHEAYQRVSRLQLKLLQSPHPVVAAVNGYCLGRGMEIALWCDIVVAASEARFGEPEIRDGAFVASIVPWLTTPQRAKLLMLTGDTFSAQAALDAGLVTQVVDGADALPAARELARRIAHVPVQAARAVKCYVNESVELRGLLTAQRQGALLSAQLASLTSDELGTADLRQILREQGMKAYLAARNAPFERH